MLGTLAIRQEDYRSIIRSLKELTDPTFTQAVTASEGMSEDQLVAIATVWFELTRSPLDKPVEGDILWAQEFLDHLDTLGWQLKRKNDDV